jgi:hypothetical protein
MNVIAHRGDMQSCCSDKVLVGGVRTRVKSGSWLSLPPFSLNIILKIVTVFLLGGLLSKALELLWIGRASLGELP